MRILLALALLVVLVSAKRRASPVEHSRLGDYELLPYDPVADPAAVVEEGNARFTVLTSRLIRMEYADNGIFLDKATLAFVNRKLEVPSFDVKRSDGNLVITTDDVKLTYVMGQPFTASTLSVQGISSDGVFKEWQPGMNNEGNLLGTVRSLDDRGIIDLNCTLNAHVTVHQESLHCAWGLISRAGWSLVDDSENYALDNNGWWAGQNSDTADWYMFAYGHAYKDALADFVKVGGRIPLTPRYASGIWWSIWMNYNVEDVQNIVHEYESRAIPLDVYVLDMDWHSKEGWGGYSFDKRLFPFPQDAMEWLHMRGLAVSANLHDDDGVRSTENMYRQLADVMGYPANSTDTIPFSAVNETYVYGLEDQVLLPLEEQGMDVWWIDWQQGGQEGGCAGDAQNPTIWLNKIRSTDAIRRRQNKRQFVLARWGGLGNHRYQVGFSGDVLGLTWRNMEYQPYFSLTASNVGYGFWSHDIVGPPRDHELHVRWVQFAAYSGIFRTHDRGMSTGVCANTTPKTCAIVKIWELPDNYFEPARAAMQAREQLIPYIYTAVREAYDNGLSLIRPMYYEFPQEASAYLADMEGNFAQYFFGGDMFVAPVVRKLQDNHLAPLTFWMPPGCWYDDLTGEVFQGEHTNVNITKEYDLTEIPLFVRCGAVIPRTPLRQAVRVGNARQQYESLDFSIYPGADSGGGQVYEDDGITLNYASSPDGSHVWTKATYQRSGDSMTVEIESSGSFVEFPSKRDYTVRVVSVGPLSQVTANGKAVPYSRYEDPAGSSYHYDGSAVTAVVVLKGIATDAKLTVAMTFAPISADVFNGVKGIFSHSYLAKRALDNAEATAGSSTTAGGYLSVVASSGNTLSYLAGTNLDSFQQLLVGLPQLLSQAEMEVVAQQAFVEGSLLQLWDESRQDSMLCGSSLCALDNAQYANIRIEGFQASPSESGAIPLNDFWDQDVADNYVTTANSAPAGYSPANFDNGYVLSTQKAGTIPLALYYSEERRDHVTVASKAGHTFAKQWGYSLVNGTLGYVYTSPQSSSVDVGDHSRFSAAARLEYAEDVLANVFVFE